MFLWLGSDFLILYRNAKFAYVSRLNYNHLSCMQVESKKEYGRAAIVINNSPKRKFWFKPKAICYLFLVSHKWTAVAS